MNGPDNEPRPGAEAGAPPRFDEAPPGTNTPMHDVEMTGRIARRVGGDRLRTLLQVVIPVAIVFVVVALLVT